MRKTFVSRTVALLIFFLTAVGFVLSGSPVSYAAAHQASVPIPASITVAENPIVESTSGHFMATVSGRGLHKNASYVLTDNNFSCTDSINTAGSLVVTTDLEGRFSAALLGGPSCLPGKYTITATLQVLPSIFVTTTFTVQAPTSFGSIHSLVFNPNPAVISTSGHMVSTLYGTGWKPGTAFSISFVSRSCTTGATTTFIPVDGDGNFAVAVSGAGCSAGTFKLLVVVGTSAHIVTLHLAAPSL